MTGTLLPRWSGASLDWGAAIVMKCLWYNLGRAAKDLSSRPEKSQWVPVQFQDSSLPAWGYLLGFDGQTLVVTGGVGRNAPLQTPAEDQRFDKRTCVAVQGDCSGSLFARSRLGLFKK